MMAAAPVVRNHDIAQKCRCGKIAKHEQGGKFYCCDCYTVHTNRYLEVLSKLQKILGTD